MEGNPSNSWDTIQSTFKLDIYLNLKMFKWNGSKILIPMISLRDLKVDPLVVRHICPSIVINEPVKTEIENPLDVGNKYRSCDNLSRQD